MEKSNFENFGTESEVIEFGAEVVAEVKEFVLLPEGVYPFTISNVEKKFYEPKPTSKLPACPMAEITLDIDGGAHGNTKLIHRLFWHSSTMWKVSELFIGVGIAKKGESFKADPDMLIGKTGKCEIAQQSYTKSNGDPGTRNELKRCLEPEAGFGGF